MSSSPELNHNNFKHLAHKVSRSCKLARDNSHPTRKLEIMQKEFRFIKTFETSGVQGIVGLLEHRETGQQVIFKLSVEIDRSIEHENQVTIDLNKLKEFCPNFVGNLGCVELPISRTFIYVNTPEDSDIEDESESESDDEEFKKECKLFMDDKEYLPTNVLFLEYISPHSFYDFIKHSDKALINSLILSILCGLSIAQKHSEFTHYDLHIDNILIKECEPEAVFVYKINGEVFSIPTYGFYPVIIDMGMSYSKALQGGTMKTSVEHYTKGLQPTFYDKLNDMHHFLLSAMNELEYEDDEFYYLSTKMMYFFRHLPVLRKKGWKKLPNNILKMSMSYIVKCCRGLTTGYKPKEAPKSKLEELRKQKIEKRNKELGIEEEIKVSLKGLNELPIWIDLDKDILLTLSLGISLPWKEELEEELRSSFNSEEEAISTSFIKLMVQLQKLYDMSMFEDINDLFFVIRELATLVFENWNIISKDTGKDTLKKLFNDFKRKIVPEFRDGVCNLNWGETIVNCKYCLNILSMLYSRYVKDNINLINNLYDQVPIKSVNDMINFYIRNCSMRSEYSENTILYFWDADNKKNKRVLLRDKMSVEDIDKLSKMNSLEITKKLSLLF
jgi:hypothetical protein